MVKVVYFTLYIGWARHKAAFADVLSICIPILIYRNGPLSSHYYLEIFCLNVSIQFFSLFAKRSARSRLALHGFGSVLFVKKDNGRALTSRRHDLMHDNR